MAKQINVVFVEEEQRKELAAACKDSLAFVLNGQLVAHSVFDRLVNRFETAEVIRQAIAKSEVPRE